MAESKYLDPKYHHLFESEVVTGRDVPEERFFRIQRLSGSPPENIKDAALRERYRKWLAENPK